MIDFHSHIVFGVDDGSDSIETSTKILKEAEKAGFDSIILTPHYMVDYYEVEKDQINEKIERLRQACREEDIDLTLYQANEIYITNHMIELLNENKASSINDSRYVLFELPMSHESSNLLEVVYSLLENGKIPVIAHPERYSFVQKDPNILLELIENGVLLQTNYGSITGQYGKDVQKTAMLLIKNNFIHFLGSDVHRPHQVYGRVDEAIKQLEKILSDKKIEELTHLNAEKVLKDEDIDVDMPTEIKQGFFQKIFKK